MAAYARGGYGGMAGKGARPYAPSGQTPPRPSAGVGRAQPSAAPAGAGGKAATPAPQQQLAADQSFSLKQRRVIDHRLRTPHRRHVNEKLLKVIAHWTATPVGTVQFASSHTKLEIKSTDAETVQPPTEDAPEGAGLVNVRALLVPGIVAEQGKHVLKRSDIIAGNRLGETRCIMAYGGLCKKGNDAKLIKTLAAMVKSQCGLDLSGVSTWYKFLELQYRDETSTIFFVPALWEASGDLKVIPQATEESNEVEEDYEEEEVDEEKTAAAVEAARKEHEEAQAEEKEGEGEEGETKVKEEFDESAVEKVMKKIKKKRTVTKVKKTKTLSPLKFALANLLEFQVAKQTHPDTVELCCAADALDEFFKREMATRMVGALRDRKAEAVAKEKEDKVKEEKEASRKKKREEEEAARKKERKAKEDKLREEWADDDDGKTDEEKRESMVERQTILKEMRQKAAQEDKERLEKEKAEVAESEKGKPQTKLVSELDTKVLDAFGYFDRVPGFAKMIGTLPRLKIENLLLCVDEDFTLEEIKTLMDVPQIPKTQSAVPYKSLATSSKYITVMPEEEKKEETKMEED